ncbi:hypothetical protein J3R30DRAFT_3700043 [Lentinula aciculospora]|uniref:Uncharacterized protein n=1 Tax=Lentinula aciculospora TaxID=153920 RepID=A0A9W9AH00_9AGAR|nr:hypothetical protein J3R30DRAFT_3700043 [Lentinula aciculospora]
MPQRIADAAHIAPYLTNRITSHHGQPSENAKENGGRIRQTKAKKSKSLKFEKSTARGREQNRNNNPKAVSRSSTSPSHNRVGEIRHNESSQPRLQGHIQEVRYSDEIPDYPPPTFQEAMSSPPLSMCPSTATLGNCHFPRAMQFYDSPGDHQPSRNYLNSDSDSDESLEVIDARGDIAPRAGYREDDCGPVDRGRALLDDYDPPTPITLIQPKRRHMSLSPLRLFAHKPIALQERALSAQPASPYSFHRNASIFRSTTSLKTISTGSFFRLPLSAPSTTSLVKAERRATSKGKERTIEPLETWEVLSPPTSLMSAVESLTTPPSPDSGTPSPVQTHVFTFDRNTSSDVFREPNTHGLSPCHANFISSNGSPSIAINETITGKSHPPNVSSRQLPSSSYISSNVHEYPNVLSSSPGSGILQNPGTSPPGSSPSSRKMVPPSPLSSQSWVGKNPNFHELHTANSLQLALETPLPLTPVDNIAEGERTECGFQLGVVNASTAALFLNNDSVTRDTIKTLPRSRSHATPPDRSKPGSLKMLSDIPYHTDYISNPLAQKPIPSRLQVPFPSLMPSPDHTSIDHHIIQTPTRRHYPGRPLPKTPQPAVPSLEATRNMVDSLYAPNPEVVSKTDSCFSSTFPNGLLIDFDEATPIHSTLSSEKNSPTSTVRLSNYQQRRTTDGENDFTNSLNSFKNTGKKSSCEMVGTSILANIATVQSKFPGSEVSDLRQEERRIRDYDALRSLSEFTHSDQNLERPQEDPHDETTASPRQSLVDFIFLS